MFDIGGVELLIIAIIAIIVVGPKDLPGMLRRVGKVVAKARSMAGEFKSHFDDVADQEEFREIRKSLDSIKDLSPTSQIKKAMSPFEDAENSLRETLDSVDEVSPSIAPVEKKAAPSKKAPKKKAAQKSKKAKISPPKKTAAKKPAKKKTIKKSSKAAAKASA